MNNANQSGTKLADTDNQPLVPANKKILLLNNYPMDQAEALWKTGEYPGHHLWGANELRTLGFDVDILPFEKWARLKATRYGDLDQTLRAGLKAHRYDIIYTACFDTSRWLAKLRKLGLLKTPVVCTAYTTRTRRAYLEGHDKVICLSERIAESLASSGKAKLSQLVSARWGPDLAYFDKIARKSDIAQDYVIAAGKTRRDYKTLVAAARDQNFKLFISANQSALAEAGTLSSNIQVRDSWVDSEAIVRELCKSIAVAIPVDKHQDEATDLLGFTSLLDALALGKPIVMTRNSLFDVDIEAIGCGYWVDYGDVEEWRNALTRITENPQLAAEMGARGRAYCETDCNLQLFGERLAAAFSLLERKSFSEPA